MQDDSEKSAPDGYWKCDYSQVCFGTMSFLAGIVCPMFSKQICVGLVQDPKSDKTLVVRRTRQLTGEQITDFWNKSNSSALHLTLYNAFENTSYQPRHSRLGLLSALFGMAT